MVGTISIHLVRGHVNEHSGAAMMTAASSKLSRAGGIDVKIIERDGCGEIV